MTLDKFSQRQLPTLAKRWSVVKKRIEFTIEAATLGALFVYFTEHELRILAKAGMLTLGQLGLLQSRGIVPRVDVVQTRGRKGKR